MGLIMKGTPADLGTSLSIEVFAPQAAHVATSLHEQLVAKFGAESDQVVLAMQHYWMGIFSGLMGLTIHDLGVDGSSDLLRLLADKVVTTVKQRLDAAGGIDAVLSGDVGAGASASGKVVH